MDTDKKNSVKETGEQGDNTAIVMPDKITGVYANHVKPSYSKNEFVIDFISSMPGTAPMVVSRVILSPAVMFKTIRLLQNNFSSYLDEMNEDDVSDLFSFVEKLLYNKNAKKIVKELKQESELVKMVKITTSKGVSS